MCRCSIYRAYDLRSTGRGELEGKIEIVEIWKNKNMQKHYQLIIASAFADVSADFSG